MNPQTREVFQTRMKVMSVIRSFLEHRGYIEIDTPVLHPAAGGADANPFFTRHEALHRSLTLRISPELHLKRMMVGGFERVFELGWIFRNEGISTRHNPEFTSIEYYQAYADYFTMMDVTEDLIRSCVLKVHDDSSVEYGGRRLEFGAPFRRVSMVEAVVEVSGVDVLSYTSLIEAKEGVLTALKDHEEFHSFREKLQLAPSLGHLLNEVFEAVVETQLWQPTIVLDYPSVISPYARPHESHPKLAQRFEVFVAGRELANGSAEITDTIALKQRLESRYQRYQNRTNNVTYNEVDYDFLNAMDHGLPPSAGTAMGVDRLIMLLTNTSSIKDVIPFPLTE